MSANIQGVALEEVEVLVAQIAHSPRLFCVSEFCSYSERDVCGSEFEISNVRSTNKR